MAEARLETEHRYSSDVEPSQIKEEPELCLKQEPEEFPFHMVPVKTEDEEDKPSVLHQRFTEVKKEEAENHEEQSDSSDTDHSEDYSQEEAPGRSYTMIPEQGLLAHSAGGITNGNVPRDMSDQSRKIYNTRFSDKAKLNAHAKTCVTEKPEEPLNHKPSSCPKCEQKFKMASLLECHIVRCNPEERPHKCSFCEKDFSVKDDLYKHHQIAHHLCPVCTADFQDKIQLKEHLKIHMPFKCSLCEKRFTHSFKLHTHQKCAHLICPFCQANFPDHMKLEEHLLTHDSFRCSECGERCSSESVLQTHLRIHMGGNCHKCSVCEKSYPNKKCLTSHMQIHTRGDRYKCSVCEKHFRIKKFLTLHMKIHTRRDLFKCTTCDKSFSNRPEFSRHRHLHHACPLCKEFIPNDIHRFAHLTTHVEEGTLDLADLDLDNESLTPISSSYSGKSSGPNPQQTHTSAQPVHTCPDCERLFPDEKALREHLKGHVRRKIRLIFDSTLGQVSHAALMDHNSALQRKTQMDISIQLKNDLPEIEKCTDLGCCSNYHCPFCDTKNFHPAFLSKLKVHLQTHFNRAVKHEEFTIHRCGRSCRNNLHYHCPHCNTTVLRRDMFLKHLEGHQKRIQQPQSDSAQDSTLVPPPSTRVPELSVSSAPTSAPLVLD